MAKEVTGWLSVITRELYLSSGGAAGVSSC